MSVPSARDARTYTFNSLERRGIALGVGAGQALVLLAGISLSILALTHLGRLGGGVVFFGGLLSTSLLAFRPVGGRTVDSWVPTLAGYATRSRSTRRRGSPDEWPPVLAGVEVLEDRQDERWRAVGVLRQRLGNGDTTYGSVIQVRGRPFALASEENREAIFDRWGAFLDSLCREASPLWRLQLVNRTALVANDQHRVYLDEEGDPSSPFYRDYWRDMYAMRVHMEQESFVVAWISLSRCGRQVRRRGGGDTGAVAVLRDETDRLLAQLREILPPADVTVLSPRAVGGVFRTAYDPEARQSQGLDSSWQAVTPAFESETATTYRSQDFVHSTLAVREWPRVPVRAGFQLPLLLETRAAWAYSIVMEPVAPSRSIREAESALTSDLSDDHLRRRYGFLETARKRRERQGVELREQELASGHGEFRYAGYITVSARSEEALERDVAEVQNRARQCHIDLVRLVAEQAPAFAYTLPLGRGL